MKPPDQWRKLTDVDKAVEDPVARQRKLKEAQAAAVAVHAPEVAPAPEAAVAVANQPAAAQSPQVQLLQVVAKEPDAPAAPLSPVPVASPVHPPEPKAAAPLPVKPPTAS